MPLQYISRYFVAETIKEGGTQYLDSGAALTFGGATTIHLSNSAFPETGEYILFDYSAGSFNFGAYANGQAMLDALVAVNVDDLTTSGAAVLTDEPANGRIKLTLFSRSTNGKQFVEGDLNFAGTTQMFLDEVLYATAGTYELFEVGGAITGLANLSCVPLKSGLSVVVPPFIDGNIIKVTLA